MIEAQVRQWVDGRMADLALLAALPATQESTSALSTNAAEASPARNVLRSQLDALLAQDPTFRRLTVFDGEGQVIVSTDPQTKDPPPRQMMTLDLSDNAGLVVLQHITGPADTTLGSLVGWANLDDLAHILQAVSGMGQTGEVYLVDASGAGLPQRRAVASPGIRAALAGENGEGLHENYAGIPVIGVYRWMPELGMVLVAEQAQEEAFAATDTVTAAVVGATLAVALVTAVIAAIVTRQITRPIVQLTESAVRIAEGDMEQRVPVASRDEIGILAYVFNRMASELKSLYDDLEGKVTQRTALLQEANYQIQRRAIQLATTVEVSQAATSILEPEQLLQEVVRLVHDSFSYSYVGIYLLDDDSTQASLKEAAGGDETMAAAQAEPVPINDRSAVGQAVLTERPHIVRWDTERAREAADGSGGALSRYIRAEAALPLRIGEQTIGVLYILSTDEEDFNADDVSVLQNVANQITIALENARAYAVEREAAKRLRELDRSLS
jgi:HAMP domain-containing protein/putative methionine-R-sulfoxide reductase with GAF domain